MWLSVVCGEVSLRADINLTDLAAFSGGAASCQSRANLTDDGMREVPVAFLKCNDH